MKTVGIIQPGKVGDIIICLPIAHYYHEQGFEVKWPIFENLCPMFQEVVDYVKFIPVKNNHHLAYKSSCDYIIGVDKVVDICFCFPGEEKNTRNFFHQGKSFDQFKYDLVNIDISEKWNLVIKRNLQDEEETFKRVVRSDKYIVCHTNTDRTTKEVNVEPYMKDYQVIHLDSKLDGTTGIFSWLTILEKANKLLLTNSSCLNLVNQLNINEDNRIYYKRKGNVGFAIEEPVLRGKWEII